MIYNTVVLNLLSQSFTCWVSKGDNNNWPQVPIALSTLDYLLIKIIKLKNSLVLLKNNACFVWNFPNIQLFVPFFSSEELYIEPPVSLPSFGLSLTSPFPINFCCHPLCELLVLTRGSHTLPAWMRKNKLGLSCSCHKALCIFGSCGMLIIHQSWKLLRARWRQRWALSPQEYFWCSQDLSLALILTFPPWWESFLTGLFEGYVLVAKLSDLFLKEKTISPCTPACLPEKLPVLLFLDWWGVIIFQTHQYQLWNPERLLGMSFAVCLNKSPYTWETVLPSLLSWCNIWHCLSIKSFQLEFGSCVVTLLQSLYFLSVNAHK